MTKHEILNAETTAYSSELGGIAIKHIDYDIDDRIYLVSNTAYGTPTAHRLKLYTTLDGYSYFKLYGRRYRLIDILRV